MKRWIHAASDPVVDFELFDHVAQVSDEIEIGGGDNSDVVNGKHTYDYNIGKALLEADPYGVLDRYATYINAANVELDGDKVTPEDYWFDDGKQHTYFSGNVHVSGYMPPEFKHKLGWWCVDVEVDKPIKLDALAKKLSKKLIKTLEGYAGKYLLRQRQSKE